MYRLGLSSSRWMHCGSRDQWEFCLFCRGHWLQRDWKRVLCHSVSRVEKTVSRWGCTRDLWNSLTHHTLCTLFIFFPFVWHRIRWAWHILKKQILQIKTGSNKHTNAIFNKNTQGIFSYWTSPLRPISLAFDPDKIRYKLQTCTKLSYAMLDNIPKVP